MTADDTHGEAGGGKSSLRRLLLAASTAVLVVLVLAGYEASRDLARLKAREAQLEQRLDATRARTVSHQERVRDLRSDPAALERVAREQLGLVHPDDLVVVLPPAEDSRDVPAATLERP